MYEILCSIGFVVSLIMLGCIIIFAIATYLYWKKKYFFKFFHDVLGWHEPDKTYQFNGSSLKTTCKHCGKTILMDSQGGWFSVD